MSEKPDDDFTNGVDKTPDDEFDKDITDNLPPEMGAQGLFLQIGFAEIHEAYLAMRIVGFTETESLKYLAFCSIYDGDI
jgi:hypothetical protein